MQTQTVNFISLSDLSKKLFIKTSFFVLSVIIINPLIHASSNVPTIKFPKPKKMSHPSDRPPKLKKMKYAPKSAFQAKVFKTKKGDIGRKRKNGAIDYVSMKGGKKTHRYTKPGRASVIHENGKFYRVSKSGKKQSLPSHTDMLNQAKKYYMAGNSGKGAYYERLAKRMHQAELNSMRPYNAPKVRFDRPAPKPTIKEKLKSKWNALKEKFKKKTQ